MDRKQFARFIKLLKEANERGEDVDALHQSPKNRQPLCSGRNGQQQRRA